ncbi:hypothetical protein [Vibrio agarivorans]|uniref:hypothetical protein n=1 Tax=Vibrio agarivorans TaxID=153622 RepID=UPI0025B4FE1E|nr:hypothetical protein [Vibrio agarivorans]MDN3661064.1 hypothetical protein [Vibrio agarivorans]
MIGRYKAFLVTFLLMCCAALIHFTYIRIMTPPIRQAVTEVEDTYQQVRVRNNPVISDTKVIRFVEDVVAECFSLTALNATSKSDYCQEQYFSSNAGVVYKAQFATPKQIQLNNNDGSFYTTLIKPPIVVSTPDPKRNRLYYALYAEIMTTTVMRTRRPSENRVVRLFVRPTLNAKNPEMMEIIGVLL